MNLIEQSPEFDDSSYIDLITSYFSPISLAMFNVYELDPISKNSGCSPLNEDTSLTLRE
jgi:hypothetical protein